jgi:hypothetical protein
MKDSLEWLDTALAHAEKHFLALRTFRTLVKDISDFREEATTPRP